MRLAVLSVPPEDAELGADRLRQAGAWAIEEVTGPPTELRTAIGSDAETIVRLGPLPVGWSLAFVDADETWSEAWRDHALPVVVDDHLTIWPAWRAPVDRTADAGRLDIVIEPGAAFGLGDHPTTRLSAAAVHRLAGADRRLLDVGCGTGILAVVAARRGASVTAIDIAPAAIDATVDNARRNGVAGSILASSTPLEAVAGEFDVVVANILAPELIALSGELRRVTARHGRLVVSGILADRHEHVVAALAPFRVVRTEVLDGWAALELRPG